MATGTHSLHQNEVVLVESITASSNATVTGALAVTGAANVTGALTVTGAIVSSGGVTEAVATATTSSTINAGGVALLAGTSTQQPTYTMAAPTVGARKTLVATGASTAQVVTLVSGGFQTTASSTSGGDYGNATFVGVGQAINLYGISTSRWQICGATGTVTLTT